MFIQSIKKRKIKKIPTTFIQLLRTEKYKNCKQKKTQKKNE